MRAIDKVNAYIMVLFYVLVMLLAVLTKHPVHLAVLFVGGTIMALLVAGTKPTLRTLGMACILALLIVLINPLVSREGMTKLYLFGDYYITLESVVYGANSALMLATVFMWFVSFNVTMTGDKYIYVLGRFLPSFSLLVSLTLRLIPELRRDFESLRCSLQSMGMADTSRLSGRVRLSAMAMKGVIRRTIEMSAIRADSMESRGYGVRRRTSYLRYRWRIRDTIFLVATTAFGALSVAGHFLGLDSASYYPVIRVDMTSAGMWGSVAVTTAFVLTPIIMEIEEVLEWKRYLLRISA